MTTSIQNINNSTVNITNNNITQLDDVKVCKECLTVKSLDAFHKYKYNGQIKYKNQCKSCKKEKTTCSHGRQRSQCKKCSDPVKVTINYMISNNKHSDKKHNRYNEENFIDKPFLIQLINQKKRCNWCKCKLTYTKKHALDLGTIERLDNSIGHIKSNCTLACYSCNSKKLSNKKSY